MDSDAPSGSYFIRSAEEYEALLKQLSELVSDAQVRGLSRLEVLGALEFMKLSVYSAGFGGDDEDAE